MGSLVLANQNKGILSVSSEETREDALQRMEGTIGKPKDRSIPHALQFAAADRTPSKDVVAKWPIPVEKPILTVRMVVEAHTSRFLRRRDADLVEDASQSRSEGRIVPSVNNRCLSAVAKHA